MKFNNKRSWHELTYTLLYPGFVGSMIYEIIPQNGQPINHLPSHLTLLKIAITIFYCFDFLHLYSDLQEETKPENRTWAYILCDLGTCSLFFAAFVCAKINQSFFTVTFLSLVPAVILIYKWNNIKDRWYFGVYSILSVIFSLFFYFEIPFGFSNFKSTNYNALLFCVVSLVIYFFYIYLFYERISKNKLK